MGVHDSTSEKRASTGLAREIHTAWDEAWPGMASYLWDRQGDRIRQLPGAGHVPQQKLRAALLHGIIEYGARRLPAAACRVEQLRIRYRNAIRDPAGDDHPSVRKGVGGVRGAGDPAVTGVGPCARGGIINFGAGQFIVLP